MASETKIKIQYFRSQILHAGKAQVCGQGFGLYTVEPDCGARGHSVDSWHGEEDSSPGPDC